MTGIKETSDLIDLTASLGLALKGAKVDGQIDSADFVRLFQVVPFVQPAIAGISEIPTELADLDEDEIAALSNRVVSIVGTLSSAKAERVTGKSLKAGLALLELVQELRADDAEAVITPAATE